MRLLRCHIENFGKLSDRSLEFEPGLNRILAPNGFGKTTLAAFIKAMLFGLPRTSSRDLSANERKKYMPWQGGPFGGFLEFEHEGAQYRVTRFFGKTAAKELRRTSPKDTGEYAKSWKSKVTSETARTIHVSVYADHHQYSLTHLLENGHAKRGGGRVAAIPHIEPVNDEILDQIEKEIDRAL